MKTEYTFKKGDLVQRILKNHNQISIGETARVLEDINTNTDFKGLEIRIDKSGYVGSFHVKYFEVIKS